MTTTRRRQAAELLAIPADQWTVAELQSALQLAVELELSTLPPYLCGMWSIDVQGDPGDPDGVARLINSVILEEMLHLGLACNMLVAVGGSPSLGPSAPTYPGPLPGGVRPDLTVCLSGLTRDVISGVYMQIEWPEDGPVAADAESWPTIGAFYDHITAGFEALGPGLDLATDRQIEYTIVNANDLCVMSTVDEVLTQIELIKEQGEGTSTSPDTDPQFGSELAHFYRFKEIYEGATLQYVDGEWTYTGPPIAFPSVYPMAEVPPGGWQDAPPGIQTAIDDFNQAFTTLLQQLENAWVTDGSTGVDNAVGTMFELKGLAMPLIEAPRASGPGNYGPEFRVVTAGPA